MKFNPDWLPSSQELGLWQVRQHRNNLLVETDWTQMPDSALSTEQKTAWANYRQALRDITDGLTVPFNDKGYVEFENIAWPEKPE